MSDPIRVALADDHQMFRLGVKEMLQTFSDVDVVGEAATGADAIALVAATTPDVILLDLDMPDTINNRDRGVTARDVMEASPTTKVVVLTMHDQAHYVRDLLRSGVNSFITKSAGRDELYAAISCAARNEGSVMVNVSRATAAALSAGVSDGATTLTTREAEVLTALAKGGTNHVIARELGMAEPTVKRHLATIYSKLEAHTRLEVVATARTRGLLPQNY